MDISNAIITIIGQIINIAGQIIGYLDNIIIYANVSLLDFIMTIFIIGAVIPIIINIPNTANAKAGKIERKQRDSKKKFEVNNVKDYEDNLWRAGW